MSSSSLRSHSTGGSFYAGSLASTMNEMNGTAVKFPSPGLKATIAKLNRDMVGMEERQDRQFKKASESDDSFDVGYELLEQMYDDRIEALKVRFCA